MSDYSEAEQLERAKGWLKTNGIWIVAGIAIGAGGLGGWHWYQDRREAQAETASARYEELVDAFTRNDKVARHDAARSAQPRIRLDAVRLARHADRRARSGRSE